MREADKYKKTSGTVDFKWPILTFLQMSADDINIPISTFVNIFFFHTLQKWEKCLPVPVVVDVAPLPACCDRPRYQAGRTDAPGNFLPM
jgi:hypothetical protein